MERKHTEQNKDNLKKTEQMIKGVLTARLYMVKSKSEHKTRKKGYPKTKNPKPNKSTPPPSPPPPPKKKEKDPHNKDNLLAQYFGFKKETDVK